MSQGRAATARSHSLWPLACIIVAAVLLRLTLFPLYAHLTASLFDETLWKVWMQAGHDHGILNIFRASDADYVGYQWILWLLSLIYAPSGDYSPTAPWLHALVKVPPLIFDVLLIFAVYKATIVLASQRSSQVPRFGEGAGSGRRLGVVGAADARRLGLIAAAVIAFQPAVIYDSAVWAQNDAGITAAMLGAIVLIATKRVAPGWVVWSLGFLLKPHPVIIVPLLVLLTLRAGGARALLRGAAAVLLTIGVVLGPWLAHGDAGNIGHVYHGLFVQDGGVLSGSAWNLWWFWDVHAGPANQLASGYTFRIPAFLLSGAAAMMSLIYCWRRPGLRPALIAAAYLAFAFYLLPVSSHERYLYPLLGLLLPVAIIERRWMWLYAPLSVMLFANLFCSAPPTAGLANRLVMQQPSLIAATFNVLAFLAFTAVLAWDVLPQRRVARPAGTERAAAVEALDLA